MEIRSVFSRLFGSGDANAKASQEAAGPEMSIEDRLTLERSALEKERLDIGARVADYSQALASVEKTTKTLSMTTLAGFGVMGAAAALGTHIPAPVMFFVGGMMTAAFSHLAKVFTVSREADLHSAIAGGTGRMTEIKSRLDEISSEEGKVRRAREEVTQLAGGVKSENEDSDAISEGDGWIEIQGLRLEKKHRGALHYLNDLFGEIEKPPGK